MEDRLPHFEDLRSSVRYKTNNLPMILMNKNLFDIPARMSNVSLGGLQILCSPHAAQQLSRPKYSPDGPMKVVAEILETGDSKTFKLSCKVVYIHQNHSPNDYCSDAVGLEALMDNPENRQLLNRFIKRNI